MPPCCEFAPLPAVYAVTLFYKSYISRCSDISIFNAAVPHFGTSAATAAAAAAAAAAERRQEAPAAAMDFL